MNTSESSGTATQGDQQHGPLWTPPDRNRVLSRAFTGGDPRSVLYHPAGMYMWDAWMVHHQGVTHAFHLMLPRSPTGVDVERLPMGHATSTDLISWQRQPSVLPPGPPGSLDDMQHWTGDALVFDDQLFLHYTARASREQGLVQRTMLARTRYLVT